SNLTRLLQLPESAREALRSGKISEGHARAILALKNSSEKQNELLSCILNNSWTVRQAEQFVIATKKGSTSSKAQANTASENELTNGLSQRLGVAVKIKHTAKGGQLILGFSSEEQLNELTQKLQS